MSASFESDSIMHTVQKQMVFLPIKIDQLKETLFWEN